MVRPSNRDRIIWRLTALQCAPEEIAAKLRCDLDTVKDAVLRVQCYNASVSHEAVDLAINEQLLDSIRKGQLRSVLTGAMEAERVLVTSNGIVSDPVTGEPMTEPDHATRLEAAKTIPQILKSIRPTSAAVQINNAINNSNSQTTIIGGGRSFEARRRAAAERRGAADGEVPAEVVGEDELETEPVDAEYDDPDVAEETGEEDEDE